MFDPEVCAIEPDLIAWRRHMHQNPEVSFEETQTTEYLEAFLRCFGVDAIDRPAKTGLVAHILGKKPGRCQTHQRIRHRCGIQHARIQQRRVAGVPSHQ